MDEYEKNSQFFIKNNKKEGFADKLGRFCVAGTNFVVDAGKEILKNNMKSGFQRIFIQSSIKYVLVFIGIFIVIFEPFKYFVSNLIASFLFIGVLVWSLISAIKIIVGYYRLPICIIEEESVSDGTWKFIKEKWPKTDRCIKSYNLIKRIGSVFSKHFNRMPDVHTAVQDFFHYVLKDIIVFCSFFCLYFITVNFVAKPFLLLHFAGIHTWEVYLFPFVQLKNFFLFLVA